MNLEDYIKVISTERVLQLATSRNNKPWLCTVHFYNDEQGNIYWVSTKERRHSKELIDNKNVVATVVIHEDNPSENYVISVTIEGLVETITEKQRVSKIINDYTQKLGKDGTLIQQILDPKDPFNLYILESKSIWIFDNKNFPNDPKQKLR